MAAGKALGLALAPDVNKRVTGGLGFASFRSPGFLAGVEILATRKQPEECLMKKKIACGVALAMLIGLGGCGYSPGTRAVTGGLIGAGGGAAIAGATGGRPATGAAIGAGAGALGGALTAP